VLFGAVTERDSNEGEHVTLRRLLLAWVLCAAFAAAEGRAADLTAIDRKLAVEPAYTSQPKYCLLVFGPGANTRVWLVQDGGLLYVDRNGNGDLTEPGEQVTASPKQSDADERVYLFEAGGIEDGALEHKNLLVRVSKLDSTDDAAKEYLADYPDARGYWIRLDVELPGRKGAGVGGRVEQLVSHSDAQGYLRWADRPEDAPIIHFGGPWQVVLSGHHRFTVDRETDIYLTLGTAGLGPGTTSCVAYEGVVPPDVTPTVEIVYAANPGEAPFKELYELKRRC